MKISNLFVSLGVCAAGALFASTVQARDGFDIHIPLPPLPRIDVQVPIPQAPQIYVDVAPPAPRREAVPHRRHGYDWRPGYWRWEGRRHVWVSGAWIRTRADSVWIADRWERDGRGWYFVAGHWEQGGQREEPRERRRDDDEWSQDQDRDRDRRDPPPRHERQDRDEDWGDGDGAQYQVPPDRVPPRGTCKVWFRDLPPDRQSPPMSCGKAREDAREWGGMVIRARGPGSYRDGRVLSEDFGRHQLYNIPPDRLPPPGMCRVWRDHVPPDRQAPPESCNSALRHARGDRGRVLYMPGSDMGY